MIDVPQGMAVEVAGVELIAEHVEHGRREVGQPARLFNAGAVPHVGTGDEERRPHRVGERIAVRRPEGRLDAEAPAGPRGHDEIRSVLAFLFVEVLGPEHVA